MPKKIFIINARGEQELFSYHKVLRSAMRVGASRALAEKIAKDVENNVTSGAKTFDIFEQIKSYLDKEAPQAGLKFDLKQAMRKLGPTGFAFEKYSAAIYQSQGFKAKLNQIIAGKCLDHEVDFLAQKNGKIKIVECKFHNHPRGKVDTSVILEYHSRFRDIGNGDFLKNKEASNGGFLILTNGKFNANAVKYARCVGIELLGWKHPNGRGLAYLIDSQQLYPITILPSLNKNMFEQLIKQGIIFAKDVLNLGANKQFQKIIREAKLLLGT